MTTINAYAGALWSHFLTSAALTSVIIRMSGSANTLNPKHLLGIHISLLEIICHTFSVLEDGDVYKLVDAMETMSRSAKTCTGKMWINYLVLKHIVRTLIYAEKTGHCVYVIIKVSQ